MLELFAVNVIYPITVLEIPAAPDDTDVPTSMYLVSSVEFRPLAVTERTPIAMEVGRFGRLLHVPLASDMLQNKSPGEVHERWLPATNFKVATTFAVLH